MSSKVKILSAIVITVIFWAIVIGAHIAEDTAQARNCSGGTYEDKPALVKECLHSRQVKAQQANINPPEGWQGGSGMWNCGELQGQSVCWNDIEMCIPGGECYYKGNVEDYCEQNDCTPPWMEPTPEPYPSPDTDSEPVPYP